MRINVKSVSLTLAMFVAMLMFVVGLVRLVSPDYGQAFVEVMASLFPGYTGPATFGQVIIGALYGALDGAIAEPSSAGSIIVALAASVQVQAPVDRTSTY